MRICCAVTPRNGPARCWAAKYPRRGSQPYHGGRCFPFFFPPLFQILPMVSRALHPPWSMEKIHIFQGHAERGWSQHFNLLASHLRKLTLKE